MGNSSDDIVAQFTAQGGQVKHVDNPVLDQMESVRRPIEKIRLQAWPSHEEINGEVATAKKFANLMWASIEDHEGKKHKVFISNKDFKKLRPDTSYSFQCLQSSFSRDKATLKVDLIEPYNDPSFVGFIRN